MASSSRLWLGVNAALALAVVTIVLWERRIDLALSREIADLRSDVSRLVQLRHENQQLGLAAEKMRAEILAAKLRASAAQAAASVVAPKPVPEGYTAIAELQNAGTDAAGNALKTYFWALDHGDVGALAGTLALSAAARTKINSIFARLSPMDQANYGSADAMFALMYAYANPPHFAALKINSEVQAAPTETAVSVAEQFPRGQLRTHTISLYRAPAGWQVGVLDSQVNSVVKQALGADSGLAQAAGPSR